MNFEKFINWADEQVQDAVNKNKDKTFDTNKRKEYLLPLFLNYLSSKQTELILEENKKLVRTTWWLMLATWILAIATIILVFVAR